MYFDTTELPFIFPLELLTTSEGTRLPGVSGLPVQAKWRFANALLAEQDGNPGRAEAALALAVQAEYAYSPRRSCVPLTSLQVAQVILPIRE